jgi:hypothetical protein
MTVKKYKKKVIPPATKDPRESSAFDTGPMFPSKEPVGYKEAVVFH